MTGIRLKPHPTCGWGRYPVVTSVVQRARWLDDLRLSLDRQATLAQGQLRSYGDAGLAPSVVSTLELNRILHFEPDTGVLEIEAGITLDQILRFVVPRGWFLPVTPGTKHPTIGGCVAADVHGKNHHVDGSLVSHVEALTLVTAEGDTIRCDRSDYADLFWSCFGGMGLTGFVYSVRMQLLAIASDQIGVVTRRTRDLEETCDILKSTQTQHRYSVAWLDVLHRRRRGRGLVMLGDHTQGASMKAHGARTIRFPAVGPRLFARPVMQAGNAAYYRRQLRRLHHSKVHYDPYFYPLDGLRDWNRAYGRPGFLQYQFVVPFAGGLDCIRAFLDRICNTTTCTLAVLKTFGDGQTGPLGFPQRGWTLALDFCQTPKSISTLQDATSLITDAGGRLYLAKDAIMRAEHFADMYPRAQEFLAIKRRYDPGNRLRSALSDRLGIT